MLEVDYAFHSAQMAPYQDELEAALGDFALDVGRVPMISTVTGRSRAAKDFDRSYWGRNIREPVRFAEAIGECVRLGYRDFLEIGPHAVLTAAIGQCLEVSGTDGRMVASLRRDKDARAGLLAALGSLYSQGHTVKWEHVYPGPRRHVSLPAYPWQRQRYWRDQADIRSNNDRLAPQAGEQHPLLGRLCDIADVPEGTHHWEAAIEISSLPYLTQHVLQGAVVLPISAYIELALAAAESAFGPGIYELQDTRFEKILFLPPDGNLNLQGFPAHR
jgi:acyl transferase domain-containing protein